MTAISFSLPRLSQLCATVAALLCSLSHSRTWAGGDPLLEMPVLRAKGKKQEPTSQWPSKLLLRCGLCSYPLTQSTSCGQIAVDRLEGTLSPCGRQAKPMVKAEDAESCDSQGATQSPIAPNSSPYFSSLLPRQFHSLHIN